MNTYLFKTSPTDRLTLGNRVTQVTTDTGSTVLVLGQMFEYLVYSLLASIQMYFVHSSNRYWYYYFYSIHLYTLAYNLSSQWNMADIDKLPTTP